MVKRHVQMKFKDPLWRVQWYLVRLYIKRLWNVCLSVSFPVCMPFVRLSDCLRIYYLRYIKDNIWHLHSLSTDRFFKLVR